MYDVIVKLTEAKHVTLIQCLSRLFCCQVCLKEFCWICGHDWAKHNSTTGGYYQCNMYASDELVPDSNGTTRAFSNNSAAAGGSPGAESGLGFLSGLFGAMKTAAIQHKRNHYVMMHTAHDINARHLKVLLSHMQQLLQAVTPDELQQRAALASQLTHMAPSEATTALLVGHGTQVTVTPPIPAAAASPSADEQTNIPMDPAGLQLLLCDTPGKQDATHLAAGSTAVTALPCLQKHTSSRAAAPGMSAAMLTTQPAEPSSSLSAPAASGQTASASTTNCTPVSCTNNVKVTAGVAHASTQEPAAVAAAATFPSSSSAAAGGSAAAAAAEPSTSHSKLASAVSAIHAAAAHQLPPDQHSLPAGPGLHLLCDAVLDAWHAAIVECKGVLRHSCVLGFYMTDINKRRYLEYLQVSPSVIFIVRLLAYPSVVALSAVF